MLEKDQPHLDQIVADVGRMKDVQQIMILNQAGDVISTNTGNASMRFVQSLEPLVRKMAIIK